VLERLDRGRGLVVDLAIDQAVVIAGPGEIELEGEAVGQRRCGVARRSGRGPRALVLTPTRELATQIAEGFEDSTVRNATAAASVTSPWAAAKASATPAAIRALDQAVGSPP